MTIQNEPMPDSWWKASAALGLVGTVALLAVGQGTLALGWVAGTAWNLLNVILLAKLTSLLVKPLRECRWPIGWLLLAKFGGLYPAGIWLLWSGRISLIGFTAGFTAVLMAAALGAMPRHRLETAHV